MNYRIPNFSVGALTFTVLRVLFILVIVENVVIFKLLCKDKATYCAKMQC
jgi:hypothetical protein